MKEPLKRDAFAALWETLIPGDGDWPSASTAIRDFGCPLASLPQEEAAAILALAEEAFALDGAARINAVAAFETRQPALFAKALRSLYADYYSSAAAQRAIERLARSGPVESSSVFDPALLASVIEHRRGLRRL